MGLKTAHDQIVVNSSIAVQYRSTHTSILYSVTHPNGIQIFSLRCGHPAIIAFMNSVKHKELAIRKRLNDTQSFLPPLRGERQLVKFPAGFSPDGVMLGKNLDETLIVRGL